MRAIPPRPAAGAGRSTPRRSAISAIDDIAFDAGTALVVVDVQNDFADPAGSLYVHDGEQVVPVIGDLVAAARRAGATVA